MSFFLVDSTKCQHDGACVAECPTKILRLDEKTHLPVAVEDAEEFCINCGHCVAVCPHQAFSLAKMPVESCGPLRAGWHLSPGEVELLLKGRRSIRTYKDQSVARKVITKLIDIARFGPSGINRQPVSWTVVYERQKVQHVATLVIEWMKGLIAEHSPLAQGLRMDRIVTAWADGKDRVCRAAPHLVITYGLRDDMTAPQAATIALTFFELAAVSFGLGTCWAGYVNMAANMFPPLKRFLGLRSRHSCLGAMMLGYPTYKYFRIPLRNPAQIKWVDDTAAP